MKILQIVADALGDASYLVIGEGATAVVDPQRDVRPFLEAARAHGASIDYVFETHVHNDYLSGGRELAAIGARVVAPASSGLEFPHLPLGDGEEVQFGGVGLKAIAAPGHTYEHTAYIASDARGKVTGAFTGGALLMAAAGRTDLLGPDHTAELTRLQWETAQRLRKLLPASTEILPTHGAGSFCSTTGSALERRGPLSIEFERNPALSTPTLEAFRAIQLASAAPIPGYYRYMSPINRKGPRVFGEPPVPALLSPDGVQSALSGGVNVVDVRTRQEFAAAHVNGSVEIEESGSLLAYAGWLIPFNAPIVLVTYDRTQAERVAVDLFRIGYEDVRGFLPWADWIASARPTATTPVVDAAQARTMLEAGAQVIDVRFAYEQDELPLAGSVRRPIDEMSDWAPRLAGPALLVCASGQRATMAASLLQLAGHDVVALMDGGAGDLQRP
ncbi:MAG: MBL fold metallo-hydrolase [Anaerolineaceae bacterium]